MVKLIEESSVNVNGILIWYYYICKREVWLMSHNIQPDQDDGNIDFGRFLHEHAYERSKKEVSLGNIKLDIIKQDIDQLVIGEVKKSSRYEQSAKMQLAFYLYQLFLVGINARGELLFPQEKKKTRVFLDEEVIKEIKKTEKEILHIVYKDKPPEPKKIRFCPSCAYSEMCWA
jgi:CRISPR-associated exonuclease Cas4